MHAPPSSASPLSNRAANLSVPQPPQRSSLNRNSSGFPPGIKDLSPSVTITPAPPQSQKVLFCFVYLVWLMEINIFLDSLAFYFFINNAIRLEMVPMENL